MGKYEVMTDAELVKEIHVISGVLAGRTFGEKQEVETVGEIKVGDYVASNEKGESAYNLDSRDMILGKVVELRRGGEEFMVEVVGFLGDLEDEMIGRKHVMRIECFDKATQQQIDSVFGSKIPTLHTANEARAELIQRAKEFVLEEGRIISIDNTYLCRAEFKVNTKKRTVTCMLIGVNSGHVRKRATTRCHPNDVFNADIGKAISLCMVRQIDAPEEFLNAVQPDEWAVGQIVTFPKGDRDHMKWNYRIDSIVDKYNNLTKLFEVGKANADLTDGEIHLLPIIDDTNAEYAYDS